jgi:hypothetical protein
MTPKLPEPPARSMYGNLDDLLHAHAVACFNAGMERAAEICEQRAGEWAEKHTNSGNAMHSRIAFALEHCAITIRKEITP